MPKLVPVIDSVKCKNCHGKDALMWHPVKNTDNEVTDKEVTDNNEVTDVFCNDCYEKMLADMRVIIGIEETKAPIPIEKPKAVVKKTAKNSRSYKTRQNPSTVPKQGIPKGKGRRAVFKKIPPVKLLPPPSTYRTVDYVLHQGHRWRIGDIVSCRDVGGDIFYAQIKGLMTDQFCQKSISISWLIPTRSESPFPRPGFNPATFVYGPDDDLPRDIECFEFVMHCPSDYYRRKTPFPTGIPDPTEAKFVWTRLKQPNKQ